MKQTRLKLVLGKFRVTRVQHLTIGYKIVVELPGAGNLILDLPGYADVREGDLLTLYTELLTKERPHDKLS